VHGLPQFHALTHCVHCQRHGGVAIEPSRASAPRAARRGWRRAEHGTGYLEGEGGECWAWRRAACVLMLIDGRPMAIQRLGQVSAIRGPMPHARSCMRWRRWPGWPGCWGGWSADGPERVAGADWPDALAAHQTPSAHHTISPRRCSARDAFLTEHPKTTTSTRSSACTLHAARCTSALRSNGCCGGARTVASLSHPRPDMRCALAARPPGALVHPSR
jgi:hypothetical protein